MVSFSVPVSFCAPDLSLDYGSILQMVDMAAVKTHVQYFESLGSRVVGYNTSLAAEYIHDRFVEYGLTDVQYHYFNTASPIDCGASLAVLSTESSAATFKIYPLEPNVVSPVITPPEGLTGKLVYAADAAQLDGTPVEGNILLIDFNTHREWLTAVKLGVKAVIFIAPEDTTRIEADLKKLEIPMSFPRFYMSKSNAAVLKALLKAGNVEVRVTGRTEWRNVQERNVMGFVRGREQPDQTIVLSAYYDSKSIVPSLSPGASEAISISILLELAKYFQKNPPIYNIMFVGFSGHNKALIGSRWFWEDYLFDQELYESVTSKVLCQFHLQLSSGNTYMHLQLNDGYLYNQRGIDQLIDIIGFQSDFWKLYTSVSEQTGKEYNFARWISASERTGDPMWEAHWPTGPWPGDAVPLAMTAGYGFTFFTGKDFKPYYGTPLDTVDRVNFDNVRPQFEFLILTLSTFANTPNLKEDWHLTWKPTRLHREQWYLGYKFLRGTIAEYNLTAAWYEPVGNSMIVCRVNRLNSLFVEFAHPNGTFFLPGVFTATPPALLLDAYVVHPDTGTILYASDRGYYKFAEQAPALAQLAPYDMGYLVVFKCGSIVILDSVDPRKNSLYTAGEPEVTYYMIDHLTQSEPIFWGGSNLGEYPASARYYPLEPSITLRMGYPVSQSFVFPGQRVDFLVQTYLQTRYPLGVMTNATKENPAGTGYSVEWGEQILLDRSDVVRDTLLLNEQRIRLLENARAFVTPRAKMFHEESVHAWEEAETLMKSMEYGGAFQLLSRAWSYAKSVYDSVRGTSEDASNTAPLFALMLVPFVFLAERLLLNSEGKKRIASLAIIYLVMSFSLRLLHVGFELASNILMLFISCAVVILILPPFALLYTRTAEFLTHVAGRYRFREVGVGQTMMSSFSVGTQNIRKRRLRSILTMTSVILFVACLSAFTSLSSLRLDVAQTVPGTAPYSGILIKQLEWGHNLLGLNLEMLSQLGSSYDDSVAVTARAWVYPVGNALPGRLQLPISYGEEEYDGIGCMVGIMENEPTSMELAVAEGRWIVSHDDWACLVSLPVADRLGIDEADLPAHITVAGREFRVVGIFDDGILDMMTDLDHEMITPLFLDVPAPVYDSHFESASCIVIQFKNAIMLPSIVCSVNLKFDDPTLVQEAAFSLYPTFPGLAFHFGSESGETYVMRRGSTVTTFGWESQVIPVSILFLTILNLMIAGVYERIREIFIYSTVGMSPLQIAVMFLSESLVYAMVGGLLGYVGSLIAGQIMLLSTGSLFSNFSSMWVFITVGASFLVIIVSSLYPAFRVARVATPSEARAWTVPTKPIGDEWAIPFPFFYADDKDAQGATAFLQELLAERQTSSAETFQIRSASITEKELDGKPAIFIDLDMSLAPYEEGITQKGSFILSKNLEEDRWYTHLYLSRTSGTTKPWINSNRVFMDELRKHLLVWKTLNQKVKDEMIQRYNISVKKTRRN